MKTNLTKESIEKLKGMKTSKMITGELIYKSHEKTRDTKLSK
jgi:hypothetical protein